ncbi:pilin [Patescibacteria group bacterium]|nr:pilin [Patescibacteria group bacterium]
MIIFSAMLMPSIVSAFNVNNFEESSSLKKTGDETGHTRMKVTGSNLEYTIPYIINSALSLVGVIFLILMLYSGFLWMTAKDDNKAIDKAKENIKSALIGLIIVLGAYAITQLVLELFKSTVNTTA